MPQVRLVLYKEEDGSVPVVDWLRNLPLKPRTKCLDKIDRLRQEGHQLRRPEADYLRDGIYELRIRLRSNNYRILYFFHGNTAAVLAHGIIKEARVPPVEIERAMVRMQKFMREPERHTSYLEI